jgi:hypothetical protein
LLASLAMKRTARWMVCLGIALTSASYGCGGSDEIPEIQESNAPTAAPAAITVGEVPGEQQVTADAGTPPGPKAESPDACACKPPANKGKKHRHHDDDDQGEDKDD